MRKRTSLRGLGADAFFPPPANQQDPKPANQQASTPASTHDNNDAHLVKATFYLTEAQVLKLEQLRLERHKKGERTDKSALVREAIDHLQE